MIQIQYDLFKTSEESELASLKKEVAETKKSCDKVRRGLFARHNELAKQFLDLKREHDIILKGICNGEALLRFDRKTNGKVESIESGRAAGSFEDATFEGLLALRM